MGRNKGQNPGAFMYTKWWKVLLFYISVVGVSIKGSHGMVGEKRKTFVPPFSAAINKMNEAFPHPFIL